jgi:uncharacterized protein (TIGR02646 family)
MPYESRETAPVMAALAEVTQAEHTALRTAGSSDANYWNVQPEAHKLTFRRFKAEIKDYYLFAQGMRCCYCSFELANDHSTFDAEHILDKSTHPQFMFELNNLAVACKPCNRAKNAKSVLVNNQQLAAVPLTSADYRLVHPHLDDWGTYLEFDNLSRIRPRVGSQKGESTIEICNIATLNAARLCKHFVAGRRSAESLLRNFFRYKRRSKKEACLKLLRNLANDYGLAQAVAIVDHLEQELVPADTI